MKNKTPATNVFLRTRCIPFERIFTTACLFDRTLKTYILLGPVEPLNEICVQNNEEKKFVGVCGDAFFKFHFFENLFIVEGSTYGNEVCGWWERQRGKYYWCNQHIFSHRNVRFHSPRFHHQYSHIKSTTFEGKKVLVKRDAFFRT